MQATMQTRRNQIAATAVRIHEEQEKQAAVVRALTSDEQRFTLRVREMAVSHGIDLSDNSIKWAFDADAETLGFRRVE